MRDRQLQLAKEEYAGTREMLRRVGILAAGADESKSFTITVTGEAKASISGLRIDCKQPDGSWLTFDVLAGQAPKAFPGRGNLRFSAPTGYEYLRAMNIGYTGTLYIKVTDDTGATIYYTSRVVSPGSELVNDIEIVFDMPNRNYVLTVEVGHL